eukprot:scaffold36351_cov65-Phaeocystis_antarctica.AAC.9
MRAWLRAVPPVAALRRRETDALRRCEFNRGRSAKPLPASPRAAHRHAAVHAPAHDAGDGRGMLYRTTAEFSSQAAGVSIRVCLQSRKIRCWLVILRTSSKFCRPIALAIRLEDERLRCWISSIALSAK